MPRLSRLLAIRWGPICPYCGRHGTKAQFLTLAQRSYVRQYCALLDQALASKDDGDHTIDMDAVADSVGKDSEKPPFYYAEESQQNKFTCDACGGFNDILGTFGYCSVCGTRNDLMEFETNSISNVRVRINKFSGPFEDCVRDIVASFDSFVGQYVNQLLQRVPLTKRRQAMFKKRFHNLKVTATELNTAFDIDILAGMSAGSTVNFRLICFQ